LKKGERKWARVLTIIFAAGDKNAVSPTSLCPKSSSLKPSRPSTITLPGWMSQCAHGIEERAASKTAKKAFASRLEVNIPFVGWAPSA